MMKSVFHFILRTFSLSRYSKFSLDFLVMQKKRLDYKDKIIFKIYGITAWLTSNYNIHISQHPTK